MQLFLWCLSYHVSSIAALATPNKAPSMPRDNYLTPPPPTPGESVDSYLTQLFGPLDGSASNTTASPNPNDTLSARSLSQSQKRDSSSLGTYREYYGIHELAWDNVSTKTSYTLSMDLSNSCTGLNLSAPIGVYTFTNGTTDPSATLGAMIEDVWTLKPTPADPRRRWNNHTATLAQLAQSEAASLLPHLICPSNTTTPQSLDPTSPESPDSPVHTELRHLLSSAWSYWCATIISTVFGAGLGASLAAGIQHHFSGNITAQNVVQTAAVVGSTVFIGGVLMRLHELGRIDSAAEFAGRQALYGRQAVLENGHISRWRQVILAVRTSIDRASHHRAFDPQGEQEVGGFSVSGQTSPGSVGQSAGQPGTPGGRSSGASYLCLGDREAAEALGQLGEMSAPELHLKLMATIREVEDLRMQQMANGEAGSTMMGPSEVGEGWPSRPESVREFQVGELCRPLNVEAAPQPTGMMGVGAGRWEASALDLVELGNMAKQEEAEGSGSGSGSGGAEGSGSGSGQGNGVGAGMLGAFGGDPNSGAGGDNPNGVAPDDKGKGKAVDGGG